MEERQNVQSLFCFIVVHAFLMRPQPIQLCINLSTGFTYTNCLYSSHSSSPWQQCAFSFTWGGVTNGYSGNSE
jgi:hypothetical protein